MKVEFRDGYREVPDYLAQLMGSFDTWQMTYEEAVAKTNWKLAADFANDAQAKLIRDSLRQR